MENDLSTQRFVDWSPLEGIPPRLVLMALHDDIEGIRLILSDGVGDLFLRLTFESPVAYRNINESYRLKTWNSMPDSEGLTSLMKVENSRWVEFLLGEAGGVLDRLHLVHYAIYTDEECVDIVTEFPPTAEFLGFYGD